MLKPVKPLSDSKGNFNWILMVIGVLVLYCAVIVTMSLFTPKSRVAYVNSGEILKRYKGAVEANKKFEEDSKKWQENINTLQAELDSLNFLFVREGNHWSADRRKEVAGFAKKREGDLQRYSQAIQQKASARQQELLQPVLADVNNAVAQYAKSESFDIILGTLDGNIVYAEKTVDITENVLDILNR